MNSIILSPYQQNILGRHLSSGNNNDLEQILFSLILTDSAYVFEHIITERNHKNFEKLQNSGLVKLFPNEHLDQSLRYISNQYTLEEERRIRENDDDYRSRFISLEDTVSDFQELKEITSKSEDRRSDILYSHRLYSKETSELEEFILNFRRNQSRVSKGVYESFTSLDSISILIGFITSNLQALAEAHDIKDSKRYSFAFMKKHWESHLDLLLEDFETEIHAQKNYLSLAGLDDSFLDKFPAKNFVKDYIDLLEAKLHFDASVALSSEQGDIINIGMNSMKAHNSNNREIRIESPENYHQIYGVMLDQINFPKVNNLDQVLRLRENKNIDNFRKQLKIWNEALSAGEIKELNKIKRSITKANKSLERVEIRKSQNWMYFVSLTAFAIGQLKSIPLSALPLTYSGLIMIDNARIKRKYNWVIR